MKKVIALFGISNSGKTTTLRLVYNALLQKEATVIEANTFPVETYSVLKIGKCKIGFETQGDPGGRLENSLKHFKSIDCKLVICATRSKGATVNAVINLGQAYEKSWRRQSDVTEQEQIEPSNAAIAELIINEAMGFIGA